MDKVFDYILKAVLIGDGIAILIATAITVGITLAVKCTIENHKKNLNKELEEFKKEQNKEIEKLKASLESKCYVTKTRFDKEFELYQKLSEQMNQIQNSIRSALVLGALNEDKTNTFQQKFVDALNKLASESNTFKSSLSNGRMFLKETLIEKYDRFYDLAIQIYNIMLCDFTETDNSYDVYIPDNARDMLSDYLSKYDENKLGEIIYEKKDEIHKLYDEINHEVNEYLNKIQIIG